MLQDLTARSDGRLLARGFVSHYTLRSLQGSISSSLITPNLEQVGILQGLTIAFARLRINCPDKIACLAVLQLLHESKQVCERLGVERCIQQCMAC